MNNSMLLLSGGGNEVVAKDFNDFYASLLLSKPKVLYIPVAWKSADFNACLSWFTNTFKVYDFEIEMSTDLKKCTYEYCDTFDSIYIGGGNTFSLLNDVYESGFDTVLKKYLETGRVVCGGSAGAIIFGKDIRTASLGKDSDTNDVDLQNTTGLTMVKDYAIQCHYEDSQYEELKEFAEKENLHILALPEESGLFVEGNTIRFINTVTEILL